VRRGGRPTTDGPFLETKEALGGYYVLEAPDLDAAIALAARLPAGSSTPRTSGRLPRYSARSAVATRVLAAQPAGTSAPSTASATPEAPSPISSAGV
jgi:hypothetical protein